MEKRERRENCQSVMSDEERLDPHGVFNLPHACVAWRFIKQFLSNLSFTAQSGEAAKTNSLRLRRFRTALKLLKNRQATQALKNKSSTFGVRGIVQCAYY